MGEEGRVGEEKDDEEEGKGERNKDKGKEMGRSIVEGRKTGRLRLIQRKRGERRRRGL